MYQLTANDKQAIRRIAQERIKDILWNAREEGNKQLQQIGKEIAKTCHCRIQFGPVKSAESAGRKLKTDYSQGVVPEGDWVEMKDLVRLTLLGNDYAHTETIAMAVKEYCRPIHGRRVSVVKAVENKPNDNPCGYSGYNFALRLSNDLTGEIQVNIPEVLYGKGPAEDFRRAAGSLEWDRIRTRFQIESSLHHALYEIWRVDKAGRNGLEAADLSKKYLDYLRGHPNFLVARELQEKLNDYKLKHKYATNEKGKLLFHWDEPNQWSYFTLRSGWTWTRH